MINPLEEICFLLSRKALLKNRKNQANWPTITEYAEWRTSKLQEHFTANFSPDEVRGKRAIDFGCGTGDLSRFLHELGTASVVGIDLSDKSLAVARESASTKGLDTGLSYLKGSPDKLPLNDASADVLLCFDVMEHVMDYEAIIPEWHRILAEGGSVLIWWSLWLHPYGHHCYPEVNLPWAHLLLSDAAILRISARIYDLPEYRPEFWHLDDHGHKIPNPCINDTTLDDYLNKLTTWKFEAVCRRSGFRIERRQVVPFTGNRFRRLKKVLASIPFLSDAFCAYVVYKLRKVDSRFP